MVFPTVFFCAEKAFVPRRRLKSGAQFFCFLVIGLAIKVWYALGIAAFFFEETLRLIRTVSRAEEFLSGALLPLYFFPQR